MFIITSLSKASYALVVLEPEPNLARWYSTKEIDFFFFFFKVACTTIDLIIDVYSGVFYTLFMSIMCLGEHYR